MKMRRAIAVALSLIIGASMAVSVSADENSGREDVKIQFYEEPPTVDSHNNPSVSTGILGMNLYARLFELDENGKPVPSLADSYEWNEDYTALTVTLRDDIKFSDGSDITAEDVIFSMERGKEVGLTPNYALIDSVTANGDKEVVFNLVKPYTALLYTLSSIYCNIMSKAAVEGGMDVAKAPTVTSGAYYLDAWNVGQDIVLKANEYYFEGEPAIKTADLIFMGDENTTVTALQSGDIDFAMAVLGFSGSGRTQIEETDGLYTIPFNNTAYTILCLNHAVEYFADENVRKAIDCAINRDDIIITAIDGMGHPAGIPVIESLGGFVEGYDATACDLEKAKEYLAASAYPDGFSFNLLCGTPQWKKAGTTIQAELAQIGITVNIEEQEVGAVVTNMMDGNYEGAIMSVSNASGDVTDIRGLYDTVNTAMNLVGLTDDTIVNAFNAATEKTEEEREQNLKEAYDAIMETVPYVPLYWPDGYYAAVEGLNLDSQIGIIGQFMIKDMSWS